MDEITGGSPYGASTLAERRQWRRPPAERQRARAAPDSRAGTSRRLPWAMALGRRQWLSADRHGVDSMGPSLSVSDPRSERSHWPTILLIVGAGVISAFQVGKATVALAAIQSDLGVSLAIVSWLLSAFAIVGAVALASLSGSAVDHIGARRMAVRGSCAAGRLLWRIGAFSDGATHPARSRACWKPSGFLAVTVAAPAPDRAGGAATRAAIEPSQSGPLSCRSGSPAFCSPLHCSA